MERRIIENKQNSFISIMEKIEIMQEYDLVLPNKYFIILMQEYHKYLKSNKKIGLSEKVIINTLNLIEIHYVRRKLISLSLNKCEKLYIDLHNEIIKKTGYNSIYLKRIYAGFFYASDDVNFPTNDEVKQKLKTTSVYKSSKNNIFLRKCFFEIETFISKSEIQCIDSINIEHIMPKSLNNGKDSLNNITWKKQLGAEWESIHNIYLHTIGNLTLISKNDNNRIGNRIFKEKKDRLDKSKLKINDVFKNKNLKKWDKKIIEKRAIFYSRKICIIWKYPDFDCVYIEIK